MKFEKHIFICTNQRAPGEKKSCGETCGMELVNEFKKLLKENNLKGRMRAQRAGCLDACEYGPTVVVYPEGVFYGGVKPQDVAQIVTEHLLNDRPVERLIINFNEKPSGMMDSIPEKYRHDLEIIRETAAQIIRDLNISGFEIAFSGNSFNAFDELKSQLKPVINKLLKDDSHTFQALLYRIDVSEKDYKKTISEPGTTDFEERFSELIIRREFQKVLTRKYFSDKKNL